MSTIAIRDVTLYYEEVGHGPVLLFIHGMCGDARVWRDQVERLSPHFRCITYDRRGHTRSSRGSEPECVETHAEDAAALIDALGVRPVVVGSSGGARIAVDLIRRYEDRLGGAVLSEPPIFSLLPDGGQAFMGEVSAAVRPAAERGDVRGAVDAFFSLVCPGLWLTLDEAGKDRYRANGPMMLAELSGTPNAVSAADLAAVRLPCLIVTGDVSHPSLRAISAVLARSLANARFIELAGSGHVTYAERPAEFAAAVAAFAREVVPQSAGR